MGERQESVQAKRSAGAIRLTNATAKALRRQANMLPRAVLGVGVVLTAAAVVLAVYWGLRWLPAVPLTLLAAVLLDGLLVWVAHTRALTLTARAICTEAAARGIRQQQDDRQRREQAVLDLVAMHDDTSAQARTKAAAARAKKPSPEPFGSAQTKQTTEDELQSARDTQKQRAVSEAFGATRDTQTLKSVSEPFDAKRDTQTLKAVSEPFDAKRDTQTLKAVSEPFDAKRDTQTLKAVSEPFDAKRDTQSLKAVSEPFDAKRDTQTLKAVSEPFDAKRDTQKLKAVSEPFGAERDTQKLKAMSEPFDAVQTKHADERAPHPANEENVRPFRAAKPSAQVGADQPAAEGVQPAHRRRRQAAFQVIASDKAK